MRKLGWWTIVGALFSIPVWAWDAYGPYRDYNGGTRSLQLQTDISNLERQVRELQRQVDQLRSERAGLGSHANQYPLPGQAEQGFQRNRDGGYELSLNGVTLRIDRNGDLNIHAAGALRLEGKTIVTNARSPEAHQAQ